MLKGYVIGQINILDIDMYKKYAEKVPKIIENYDGKYLIRGGQVTQLDGETNGSRNVVIEFESVKKPHAHPWGSRHRQGESIPVLLFHPLLVKARSRRIRNLL